MAKDEPPKKSESSAKMPVSKEELAKERSKKFVMNMMMVTVVVTMTAALLISFGMGFVFALLGIGLLPGIVANISDGRPGRYASKTVMAFNISGISPHLAAIISSGSPNNTAISILSDPKSWLLIYGFAAFGWGVVYIIPQITHMYLEIKASYKSKKMHQFQEKLVEEWGEEIKH